MTNLYLTTVSADAAVTAGSGTKWKTGFNAGASSTHLNKNSSTNPASALQMTDGVTPGTDGTVVSWYTPPLRAVTIAGAITCSMWVRENATADNVAPTIRIERCSGDGSVLSVIVDENTSQGAGEAATTAGGASDVITLSAANVIDTTLADGDRLRVTLWIDNAADQAGTGTMLTGGRGEFWVNGPTGSAGQSQMAFAEVILPLAGPRVLAPVESVRSTATPKTVAYVGCAAGDTLYLLAGGDGGLNSGQATTAVTPTTTVGTTSAWTLITGMLPASGGSCWLRLWKATVLTTSAGAVTASVAKVQSGTVVTWHAWGFVVGAGTSSGEEFSTDYTSDAVSSLSMVIAEGSAVATGWFDWDTIGVGTPTPQGGTLVENSSDVNYSENSILWVGQPAGTRNYGTTSSPGGVTLLHVVEILGPSGVVASRPKQSRRQRTVRGLASNNIFGR